MNLPQDGIFILATPEADPAGPYTLAQVRARLSGGQLDPTKAVYAPNGGQEWRPVSELLPTATANSESRFGSILFGLFALLLLGGGGLFVVLRDVKQRELAAHPTPPPDITVTGQVFVVTKGRDNVKLGLVPLLAFHPDALQKHLEGAITGFADAGFLEHNVSAVGKNLPRPERSTKTDADGVFTITIQRGDVLIAIGQRDVFRTTEEYLWIVQPKVGERVILSNDNLLSDWQDVRTALLLARTNILLKTPSP